MWEIAGSMCKLSRNDKYNNTSSLHNTSNNRINAHIFNNDLEIESNPFHQNNSGRENFIDMENQLVDPIKLLKWN